MPNTACEAERFMIQELTDGALEAPDREVLSLHLASCADCRRYQEGLHATIDTLNEGLRRPLGGEAPDLVAAIGLGVTPVTRRPVASKRNGRAGWAWAWGVAAACALISVGLNGTRAHPGPSVPVAVASPASPEVASLADTEDSQAILTWFGPDADADAEE